MNLIKDNMIIHFPAKQAPKFLNQLIADELYVHPVHQMKGLLEGGGEAGRILHSEGCVWRQTGQDSNPRLVLIQLLHPSEPPFYYLQSEGNNSVSLLSC